MWQQISDKYNKAVIASVKDNVCTIQMNRPQKLNALNPDLVRGLLAMFQYAAQAKDVHVVILTGGKKILFKFFRI